MALHTARVAATALNITIYIYICIHIEYLIYIYIYTYIHIYIYIYTVITIVHIYIYIYIHTHVCRLLHHLVVALVPDGLLPVDGAHEPTDGLLGRRGGLLHVPLAVATAARELRGVHGDLIVNIVVVIHTCIHIMYVCLSVCLSPSL